MYLYVELWKAKDAWIRLTDAERQAKIDQLLAEAKQHPIDGVIPFSLKPVGDVILLDGVTEQPVIIDDAVARPTGFRYAAAWAVPTREVIQKFEERVENLGWWFEYFQQENAWGLMDVQATVGDMVAGASGPAPPDWAPAPKGLVARIRATEKDVRDAKRSLREILELLRQRRAEGKER
jgi:hypothetical protein